MEAYNEYNQHYTYPESPCMVFLIPKYHSSCCSQVYYNPRVRSELLDCVPYVVYEGIIGTLYTIRETSTIQQFYSKIKKKNNSLTTIALIKCFKNRESIDTNDLTFFMSQKCSPLDKTKMYCWCIKVKYIRYFDRKNLTGTVIDDVKYISSMWPRPPRDLHCEVYLELSHFITSHTSPLYLYCYAILNIFQVVDLIECSLVFDAIIIGEM